MWSRRRRRRDAAPPRRRRRGRVRLYASREGAAAVSRECRSRAGNLALGSATQEKTRKAKLRVKSQIFSSDIDHHVSVQYTPFIGDEKRDYVEYTSEAFLSQLHTMATYALFRFCFVCSVVYRRLLSAGLLRSKEGQSVDGRGGDFLFIQGARGSGWSTRRLLGAVTGAGTSIGRSRRRPGGHSTKG